MTSAENTQKTTLEQAIAQITLRLFGWQSRVVFPSASSYVLIGAPHTSNWDFVIILLVMIKESIPIKWMGKEALFRGPVGVLMRSIGAIPVNRRENTNLVDQIAAKFDEYDNLIIGLAPEGTRSNAPRWRTGFYHIALKANVPIAMGYVDYENKICGIGPSLNPTGDIQADFVKIKDFYSGIVGKFPHKQGEITLSAK